MQLQDSFHVFLGLYFPVFIYNENLFDPETLYCMHTVNKNQGNKVRVSIFAHFSSEIWTLFLINIKQALYVNYSCLKVIKINFRHCAFFVFLNLLELTLISINKHKQILGHSKFVNLDIREVTVNFQPLNFKYLFKTEFSTNLSSNFSYWSHTDRCPTKHDSW